MARRLNQSRASAVLQSNLIAIKFGTAKARRLNWALGQAIFCRVFSKGTAKDPCWKGGGGGGGQQMFGRYGAAGALKI